MSERPLRWGIVGAGRISHDFVMALEKGERPHKVVAVAASSLSRAEEFIKEHKLDARAYGQYEELFYDSQVDVVYIGTHNETHCPLTDKAVDEGKPVLTEKPFGLNAKQVRATLEHAREKKVLVMEGFWSCHFPAWTEIRKIIRSKKYGEPRVVNVLFGQQFDSKFRSTERGEVPTNLFGLYTILLSQFVFEKKARKVEVIGRTNPENGVEEWVNAVIEYDDDQRATVYFDSRHWLPQNASITLDKGMLLLPDHFWCPERFISIDTATDHHVLFVEEKDRKKHEFPLNDPRKFVYNHTSGLRYEADHFFDLWKEGKTESDVMPHKDSIAVVEICDDIRSQLGVRFPLDA